MPYLMGSSKILIYFHVNAEDVGLSMELMIFVRDMLKVSFLFSDQFRFTFLQWSTQATAFMMETQMLIRLQLMLKTSMIIWLKLKE